MPRSGPATPHLAAAPDRMVRVRVRVRRLLLQGLDDPTPTPTPNLTPSPNPTPNPNQGLDELCARHCVDVTQHTIVERQLELLVDEHHVAHRVELLRQLHLVRGGGRGRVRVRVRVRVRGHP